MQPPVFPWLANWPGGKRVSWESDTPVIKKRDFSLT